MEVKLGTHMYFSVSMTTMNKKCPQALFPITTSSLLKLSHHTMHEGETWYACVFQRFHDNREQKMASGPITTSSLLKLANHAMHGSETWDAYVFQRFHDALFPITTMNKKCPQALFPITTSSLLKLSHHTMHGGETWYICMCISAFP